MRLMKLVINLPFLTLVSNLMHLSSLTYIYSDNETPYWLEVVCMDKEIEKEEIHDDKKKKYRNEFGADPDEQEMNGLYGMLETDYEDKLHDKEK